MKKLWGCVIAMMASVFLFLPAVRAEAAVVASGSCGEHATWGLDDEGTLTITGFGAIVSFDGDIGSAERVIIAEGITQIGGAAFSYNEGIKIVSIPDSVTEIEGGSFRGCVSL